MIVLGFNLILMVVLIWFWMWALIWFQKWAVIWLRMWAFIWLRMWAFIWLRMWALISMTTNVWPIFFRCPFCFRIYYFLIPGYPFLFEHHVFPGFLGTPDFFRCPVFSGYHFEFPGTHEFPTCPEGPKSQQNWNIGKNIVGLVQNQSGHASASHVCRLEDPKAKRNWKLQEQVFWRCFNMSLGMR